MYVLAIINLGSEQRIVKDMGETHRLEESHTTDLRSTREEKLAMTGTIKKIIRQKGFGFITPDDGSEDVFFHRGSLAPRTQIEDFNEGDTVQFQTRKGDKGPVALDLKIR
jgi:CspA family cold shock protein